jgi:hypothetical protein
MRTDISKRLRLARLNSLADTVEKTARREKAIADGSDSVEIPLTDLEPLASRPIGKELAKMETKRVLIGKWAYVGWCIECAMMTYHFPGVGGKCHNCVHNERS